MDYTIWMDSEKALIFSNDTTGVRKTQIDKNAINQHTKNKKDNSGDSDLEHFFHDLAVHLKDAKQLLILGPGLAKNHFRTHLETHQSGHLAKKIVGLENSDHPTDNQIMAEARKFYKTYDLYHHPITTH